MKKLARIASRALPVWFGAFLIFPMFPTALPRDANIATEAWWSFYGQGLPVAPPTTVPVDSLAVGHNLAQPDKVSAVGITLQAPAGATVETLSLTLKEAEGPGANIGAETAAVSACPITGPWEPIVNGNWADVPTYDCDLAKIAGKRSPDGMWAFDLRPIGEQWLNADFPLEQAGVLLLIEQATQPTQVSFRSIKTGEFRLEFAVTAPSETEPAEPVVVGGLEPEAPAAAPPTEPSAPNDATPAVLLTQPAQNKTTTPAEPDILGNLPWGAWLLVPIALGIAGLVSYALGEGARLGGRANRRAGAVTRALSREGQER